MSRNSFPIWAGAVVLVGAWTLQMLPWLPGKGSARMVKSDEAALVFGAQTTKCSTYKNNYICSADICGQDYQDQALTGYNTNKYEVYLGWCNKNDPNRDKCKLPLVTGSLCSTQ